MNQFIADIQDTLKDAGLYTGKIDGSWGPLTQAAIDIIRFGPHTVEGEHRVLASSFADRADVESFHRCIANGGTEQQCFKVGDNGKGFGGLTDCTDETIPYVALPFEDWMEKWGSRFDAIGKEIKVVANGKTVICKLGDTMPHRKNITNGCGLDMAVGAQKAFGFNPPFTTHVVWSWV